jgi:hypothetical protein
VCGLHLGPVPKYGLEVRRLNLCQIVEPIEMIVRPVSTMIRVQIGNLDAAERELVRCREIMASGEDWRGLVGAVARAEAIFAAAEARFEDAERQFEKAAEIFRRYQVRFEEPDALYYWGRALHGSGDHARENESSMRQSRSTSDAAPVSDGSSASKRPER